MDPSIRGRRTLVRRPAGILGLGIVAAAALAGPSTTNACDVCAVYTATEQRESRLGPRIGIATQYSHFGTLQENGHEVPNPEGEYIHSSITQLFLGYQLTPRLGLQVNLPLIVRQYRRVEETGRVRGNVAGPGDLTLLANLLAHSIVTETSVFNFTLLGGLKLPTGNPELLSEELDEGHAHAARGVVAHHVTPGGGGGSEAPDTRGHVESGVHGHDLALGSGSVDGLVGGELFLSWRRAFVTGALHYTIRSAGAFDYRYANELIWSGGPGVYALLTDAYSVSVQAALVGETKGQDRQQGRRLDDTAVTNLYAGPRIQVTWGTALSAEVAADLPVIQHNTALQIVADYRVRAAAVWRF